MSTGGPLYSILNLHNIHRTLFNLNSISKNQGSTFYTGIEINIPPPPGIAEPVGASTFWSEPEPLWMSGSGSTLDKTEEILNDIPFVCSNID